MKHRVLTNAIRRAIRTFPAIVVTGPRQSGKTTLLKSLFSATHSFVTLEDPDIRIRAKEDPLAFFDQHKPPLIIDEIQYVPELLNYIKTMIDNNRKPGMWLFTGSQNFSLMHGVSQSLAGRAAVLSLLPFSYSEVINNGDNSCDINQLIKKLTILTTSKNKYDIVRWLLRGSFPEIASKPIVNRQIWCASYISTYLERDVRQVTNVGDLRQFERFLKMCAIRTGQILNISDIAKDIGISVTTAKRWISILQTGNIIYLLYPFYKNYGKRIVKSPKLYFTDTALASYLLGLHDKETLLNSPSFGHLFETMIVIDFLKRFLHFGQIPSMYYLRTHNGLEIDLVLELGQYLTLVEIKSAMTITLKHASSLQKIYREMKTDIKNCFVVSRAKTNCSLSKTIQNYSWNSILEK